MLSHIQYIEGRDNRKDLKRLELDVTVSVDEHIEGRKPVFLQTSTAPMPMNLDLASKGCCRHCSKTFIVGPNRVYQTIELSASVTGFGNLTTATCYMPRIAGHFCDLVG